MFTAPFSSSPCMNIWLYRYNLCFVLITTCYFVHTQVLDLVNQRRKTQIKRTNDHARPSRRSSFRDSRPSFRATATWPSSDDRVWRRSWDSTNPRSKSGSRIRGPKSKNPAATRTLWQCSWWRRDCTTTAPRQRKTNQTVTEIESGEEWRWWVGWVQGYIYNAIIQKNKGPVNKYTSITDVK